MFAGAASGAIGVTALAPVEAFNLMVDGGTWRTALQSLSRGWWRGNTADVLSAAPRVGITMASFAMYKRLLTVALREETTPQWAVFMAGALAGATATLATFPLDVVRTRMAVGCPIDGQWASVVDCMVSIARTEGCGALYGGLSATLVGVLPFNSIKLASYDFLRRSADAGDATSLPAATSAAFGAVAGVVAATSCFPLEMVRRRQMMGDHVGMPFHAAMVAIAQKEGARALLRGSGVNIVKVALSNSIGFALYETAKDTLGVDGRKPPWVKSEKRPPRDADEAPAPAPAAANDELYNELQGQVYFTRAHVSAISAQRFLLSFERRSFFSGLSAASCRQEAWRRA